MSIPEKGSSMLSGSLWDEITKKKKTDLPDVIVTVTVLLFGGIIGGKAFATAQSDPSFFVEIGIYAGLLAVGIFGVYIVELAPVVGEVLAERASED